MVRIGWLREFQVHDDEFRVALYEAHEGVAVGATFNSTPEAAWRFPPSFIVKGCPRCGLPLARAGGPCSPGPRRPAATKLMPALRFSLRIWPPSSAWQRIDWNLHQTSMLRRVLFFFCSFFHSECRSSPRSPAPNPAPQPVPVPAALHPQQPLRPPPFATSCPQPAPRAKPIFARFLTFRNKQAFARMTPLARIALMKRFVLLNEPGKPTASHEPRGASHPPLPNSRRHHRNANRRHGAPR